MTKRADRFDFRGTFPESWCCIDCGVNTWPGNPTRKEWEQLYRTSAALTKLGMKKDDSIAKVEVNDRCEVYTVRNSVWKAAGMEPYGGCLCGGCLERRLGRTLEPRDFPRRHPFNQMLGTERLVKRRRGNGPDWA